MKALVIALTGASLACSAGAAEPPARSAEAPSEAEPEALEAPPDIESPAGETAAESPTAPAGKQECNLLLGSEVTNEWYSAGFEQIAGDRHWQAIFSPRAVVQHWTDPAHAAWSKPVVSSCMHHAETPDRIVLVVSTGELRSKEAWLSALTELVESLKKKYPGIKRIELMTMIRGPGGASCGNAATTVAPFIDEAVDNVATNYPDLVKAAPKFELDSCSGFKKGGPHFSAEGAAAAAQLVGGYFASGED